MLNINSSNFLNIFLGKSNLIEASAGTGKTNILSLIYLRFLFNINIDYKFNNLFIDNILIVTFTDLATLEIKNRLLNNIVKLRILFENHNTNDYFLKNIYLHIKKKINILNLIIDYENNINNFSIFTIHSFCKKILYYYFINSNINYFSKIINYNNNFIYNIVILFWRKYFYNLSFLISEIIYFYWSNPNKLFLCILPILNFTNLKFNFLNKYSSINDCYNKIINYIINFKKRWLLNFNSIYKLFISIKKYKFLYKYININKYLNEINLWAKSDTNNFYIPKCIYKFSYKYLLKFNINISIKNKLLLSCIDYLFLIKNDFYNFIIFKCIKYIKKEILFLKKKDNCISFNDLIEKLYFVLLKDRNNFICNYIRKNFPILLIDEFQDTDLLQYKIFKLIYLNKNFNDTKIIFVGDPKQSIYSFRGANIFSYIKFKKNIDYLYFLNINWRSSYILVKSINFLFNNFNNPFIFNNIKYFSILPAKNNKKLLFFKKKKVKSTMNFFIINNFNNFNYKKKIAKFCAIKIFNILNSKKYYLNDLNNFKRNILPSDISILVYKNYEIKLLFDVFKKFFLPVDCILDKSNVFNSLEAKEIFFILKGILYPESNLNIRNALSTNIFGYDFLYINDLLENKNTYVKIIDDFYSYYKIWNDYNIYSIIIYLLKKKKNINNNYNYKDEQSDINISHIAEILLKKSFLIKNKYLLLDWLNKKINNININYNKKYYIRSIFNKNDGIKISTIHKSKGLQYNIVWIPFLINLNLCNYYNIYHNRKNNIINIDLYKNKKYKNYMYEELSSEEMRILYVAITRSIYQCNILLYEISKLYNKKFCFTSIGKLISKNNYFDFLNIKNIFSIFLKCKYIKYYFINLNKFIKLKDLKIYKYFFNKNYNLNIKINKINKLNKIINFTNIVNLFKKHTNYISKNNIINKKYVNILPRGKKIGIFFHKILEKINFFDKLKNKLLLKNMFIYNIKKKYFFNIKKILLNILNVFLYPLKINLININSNNYFKEFEFFLPINKSIDFIKFNNILKKYNKISSLSKDYIYKYSVKGFLNGFIDFIFMYNNKFYIIDYKLNWLGDNFNFYNKKNILKTILYHRYDIQYQIYSFALHRYLKLNFKNYNYNNNFGGVYYIFLRGLFIDINNNRSYTGISYFKPTIKLISELENIFI